MRMIPPVDTNIRSYTGGMAQTNAYLIGDNDNCILIDAPLGVSDWLKNEGATPTDVILTHQHYDHVEGAAELAEQGAHIYAHSLYSKELTLEVFKQQIGWPITVTPYSVDTVLENATTLKVKNWEFTLKHIPGHAPDSLVFIHNDTAFVGDTLFAGSIGRPDLPGGDIELLMAGILKHLMSQDDSLTLLPGHGPSTTVGDERKTNPYILQWLSQGT